MLGAQYLGDDVIDLIVISHPDYDHFAGLKDVVEGRAVRQVWYSGYDSGELSTSWHSLLDTLSHKDGTLFLSPLDNYMGIGSAIRFDDSGTYDASDDVVLTLINTKRWLSEKAYGGNRTLEEGQRRNSSSVVIRLDYGNTSFLFPGDTNGRDKERDDLDVIDDQELYMVQNNDNTKSPLHGKLNCSVLKVPHHGSNGSSSLGFLKSISPTWAVISAGVYYDHPDGRVLGRLKHSDVGLDDNHILRTDEGEDQDKKGTEANLGDDCYQFIVSPEKILRIEKWNVEISDAD